MSRTVPVIEFVGYPTDYSPVQLEIATVLARWLRSGRLLVFEEPRGRC